jgi:ribose 1,5-bisphosphokinase PhnN
MERLLSAEDGDVLFVGGTASNQGRFHARFDHVVLLTAPVDVLMDRLATRTTNTYGKHPEEMARVLRHTQTVEPLLRRAASMEIDTSAPIDHVLQRLLSLVER